MQLNLRSRATGPTDHIGFVPHYSCRPPVIILSDTELDNTALLILQIARRVNMHFDHVIIGTCYDDIL